MFEKEIDNFLKINQIAFEQKPLFSVFKTHFLPQHNLFLHLISIQKFQESNLLNDYFHKLSEQQNADGFRIIHLWEDVWINQKELVKSRILAMIGVFKRINARHCFVQRIDKPQANKFLNINHLQGSTNAKFKYGLFLKPQYAERFGMVVCEEHWDAQSDNGRDQSTNSQINQSLIAVATFAGGRQMHNGTRSYELIRFASLRGHTVVGGIDKLLKTFQSEHNPDDIMTYADRDWSDGRSYEILSFKRIEITKPQSLLLNKQTFKRHSLKENSKDSILIFNAGSIKFVRKNEKIFL